MLEPPQHPDTNERNPPPSTATPRWVKVFAIVTILVIVLVVVLLLAGGHSPSRHSSSAGGGTQPRGALAVQSF
jgi:hypothetical protein